MPVDVPGTGNVTPRDLGMPGLQIIGQSPQRFGDDLQTAGNGVHSAEIGHESVISHTGNKGLCETDVLGDVVQRSAAI
jgi:hypothetical protein